MDWESRIRLSQSSQFSTDDAPTKCLDEQKVLQTIDSHQFYRGDLTDNLFVQENL